MPLSFLHCLSCVVSVYGEQQIRMALILFLVNLFSVNKCFCVVLSSIKLSNLLLKSVSHYFFSGNLILKTQVPTFNYLCNML